MGYSDYLQRLLHPLGVYDLSPGSLSRSELDALGLGLDDAAKALDLTERESHLLTAEGEGLERREQLFAHPPVRSTTALRREAIAALLRIDNSCFTLSAINNTISGCGITALVQEKDQFGYVRVIFPHTAGIPAEFDRIREIILGIIPCHLEVEFYFRYLTWTECHSHGYTWAVVHENNWNWSEFMLAV